MDTEKRREDMTQQEKVAKAQRDAAIDAGALLETPAEPLAAERGRMTTENFDMAKRDARESEEIQARASRGQLTTKGEKIPPMAIDKKYPKGGAFTRANLDPDDQAAYDRGDVRIVENSPEWRTSKADNTWAKTKPTAESKKPFPGASIMPKTTGADSPKVAENKSTTTHHPV